MTYNRHFDVATTTREVGSLYCFFVFGWIKVKFGVRGNFGLLTSNLISKTQYHFEISSKMPPFFLFDHDFQHSTPSWIGYHGNIE